MSYEVGNQSGVNDDWSTVNYGPFASSPYLLVDMQTTVGGDTANLRYKDKTASSVDIKVDEEQSQDSEKGHIYETVGYFVFTTSPVPLPLQVGIASANHDWQSVSFPAFSTDPVIVATIMTEGGGDNCHVDLKNPSTSGFTVRVEEDTECDGGHVVENIGWIAVEPGDYTVDSKGLVAGKTTANHNWTTITFPSTFSFTPVIVATIMNENGGDNCHVDIRNPSSTGFEVRVEEDVGCDGGHVSETIGWIALEPGQYTINGRVVEVGGVNTDHMWKGVTFLSSFSSIPAIVAAIMTEDGGDNCHIDMRNPSASGFEVRLEEDMSCDGNHLMEAIGWIAIDLTE